MNNHDPEWLEKARHGDEEAFNRLVECYQRPVYNLCYRMLGDAGDAEDAAQETFWRAYQNLKRYDPQRPFVTWLLSIGAHYCIDQLRKHRLPATSLEDLPEGDAPDPVLSPESSASQREQQAALHKLMAQLSPQDRAALILRYWYEFSEEEIAAALSLTVSAVKSRMHRARKELAEMWLAEQTHVESGGAPASLGKRRQYESPAF